MSDAICLIIPPSAFLLDERVFMSLGILRVAAVLEQSGRSVEMLDLSGVENYEQVVGEHAARSPAAVFGLTVTTPQYPAATRIVAALRRVRPDARVVLGGPHVTLVNAAYKHPETGGPRSRAAQAYEQMRALADVLVAGDGEEAVFAALRPDAPKLVDADDPASPMFLDDKRLDRLPFPARQLVDVDSYNYQIDGVRALSMIAQLGCPFQCGFCGGRRSPSLRRVRMRSSANVVAEMESLYRAYGVRGFMLYDDELNVNRHMLELMDQVRGLQDRLGVEFRLRGFIKSHIFNDAQAEAMYKAGFRWILTGFESGSSRILVNMNKRATRQDNTRCVETARRHGLKVKALMSLGHPGESEETVADTRDWLLEAKPDDIDIALITTYPGTPYYDEAVPLAGRPGVWAYTFPATGDRLYSCDVDYAQVAEYYKGDPEGGYRSFVFTDQLSPERLVELRDSVEREVRAALGIPFNPARASQRYEHSMGQTELPARILRRSR
ncbi:MAG: radical SAM protein [Elusimicrobiota bacterium]|jgi:radical SAM superfamily enzyme YgiQ (UPF0313 family)